MRLRTKERVVSSGGIGDSSNFKIQASGKAFTILSANLYSNRIRAVIRELLCNAYDSHKEAGVDTPISITMPTTLKTEFAVEDFGLGLSHELIMEMYSTYFYSTKTNSDELIGALGLGSKSPFSYVSGFTVVSTYNGVRNYYAAVIGDNDMPTINHLGSEETKEHNGLRVSMSVKDTDVSRFQNELENVLFYFPRDVKFSINSMSEYDCVYDIETQYSGETSAGAEWFISNKINVMGHDYLPIIQGNVGYNFSISQVVDYIKNKYGEDKADYVDSFLRANNYFLKVPIGELSIMPSREELSFDTETLDYLATAFLEIISSLAREFEHHFDDCKSEWEAKVASWELRNNLRTVFSSGYSVNHDIIRSMEEDVKWNGLTLGELLEPIEVPIWTRECQDKKDRIKSEETVFIDKLRGYDAVNSNKRFPKLSYYNRACVLIDPKDSFLVIIHDETTNKWIKEKYFLENISKFTNKIKVRRKSSLYDVSKWNLDKIISDITIVRISASCPEAYVKEYIDIIPDDIPVVRVSDMDDPPKSSTVGGRTNKPGKVIYYPLTIKEVEDAHNNKVYYGSFINNKTPTLSAEDIKKDTKHTYAIIFSRRNAGFSNEYSIANNRYVANPRNVGHFFSSNPSEGNVSFRYLKVWMEFLYSRDPNIKFVTVPINFKKRLEGEGNVWEMSALVRYHIEKLEQEDKFVKSVGHISAKKAGQSIKDTDPRYSMLYKMYNHPDVCDEFKELAKDFCVSSSDTSSSKDLYTEEEIEIFKTIARHVSFTSDTSDTKRRERDDIKDKMSKLVFDPLPVLNSLRIVYGFIFNRPYVNSTPVGADDVIEHAVEYVNLKLK